MPWERVSLPMKILRVLYYPVYYYQLMERMNLMQYSMNKFMDEFINNSSYAYPLLQTYNVLIDSREDKVYSIN